MNTMRMGINSKNFTSEITKHFLWGIVSIKLKVENDYIVGSIISSNKLDEELKSMISATIENCILDYKLLADSIRKIKVDKVSMSKLEDIASWLETRKPNIRNMSY